MGYWTEDVRAGGVVIATFNDPPGHYATPEAWSELEGLITGWQDPSVRAVILQGAPASDAFITHFSVEHLVALKTGAPVESLRNLPAHRLRAALRALPKPVIAALNGHAMGGGFELALACDIRIAQTGPYRFGLPETRLGIIPAGGGTQRLARLIGAGRAAEFILRGRVVAADEALRLGIVHEVSDNASTRAMEIALDLASLPPMGLAAAKVAVYEGSEVGFEAGLEVEREQGFIALASEDALGAMQDYIALPRRQRVDWFEKGPYRVYEGR